MKARPRSVERKVAAFLSRYFVQLGLSPVERIPVLGRSGPDITSNEWGLVIDVKSRLEVPKTPFTEHPTIAFDDELHFIGTRLRDLPLLVEGEPHPIDSAQRSSAAGTCTWTSGPASIIQVASPRWCSTAPKCLSARRS